MDHEIAVRLQAAERYLLDEFSPEERREFEEHFFGCRECAEEVRAASIFSANTKAVFRGEEARVAKARPQQSGGTRVRLFWPLLASAALNLALLLGLGFQGFAPRDGLDGASGRAMQPQFY